MDFRKKILLVLSFIFLFAIACTDKNEPVEIADVEETSNAWTDSIFGKLDEKQQYFQHIILEVAPVYQNNIDSLCDWVIENQPGAISFLYWDIDSIVKFKSRIDTTEIIQPIYYTDYFDFLQIEAYPYWKANEKNKGDNLHKVFEKSGFTLIDFESEMNLSDSLDQNFLDTLQKRNGINSIVSRFDDSNVEQELNDFMNTLHQSKYGVALEINRYDTVQIDKYRKTTNFQGFFIGRTKKSINNLIAGGVDLVFNAIDNSEEFEKWKLPAENKETFNESTKRVLNLKSAIINGDTKQNIPSELRYTQLNLAHNSLALINNESHLLPLKSKFTIYSEGKIGVSNKIRKEINLRLDKKTFDEKGVDRIINSEGKKIIVINDSLSNECLSLLGETVKANNLIVCFSDRSQYDELKNAANLVFVPDYVDFDHAIMAQQFAGRISINADFIAIDTVLKGKEIQKGKLARTVPEFIGIDSDTLSGINWAVKSALNGRAFPGCQVLIAKDGCIIYDKSFGHHSYDRQKLVTEESMYDLASLTKVVATTMVAMKLYEMNSYELQDSLGDYLPDSLKNHLNYPSTIRNITFNELLIHKSGMPAGFNILSYMKYTTEEVGRFDKFYCDVSDSTYCIEVAENFYLEREYEDSMWLKLNQIWLDKSKPYKYSDVNMNTLYFMFKSIITKNPKDHGFNQSKKELEEKNLFVEFLYKTYYNSLGMEHTRYKPLDHFNKNQIVPTENERYWRKQLLQGHVHDPNAALYGGIAGNAGMFSTTNDLAILMQMMLDKGVYDGKRYLSAETVNKFITQQPESHRGLGWNKPTWSNSTYGCADAASMNTFGHTGFTGTCLWVDPDNGLVYIFLSNRVHPTVNNRIYQYGIRKRVHEITFDAMMN